MWIAIAALGYILGVGFLLRFFRVIHECDNEIENMTNKEGDNIPTPTRPAA